MKRERVIIALEKCHPDAVVPKYAREGDAGMDLHALLDVLISPNQTVIIRTGLKVAIPEEFQFGIFRPG